MIILTEDNVSIIISFLITSTLVRLPVEDEPLLSKNPKRRPRRSRSRNCDRWPVWLRKVRKSVWGMYKGFVVRMADGVTVTFLSHDKKGGRILMTIWPREMIWSDMIFFSWVLSKLPFFQVSTELPGSHLSSIFLKSSFDACKHCKSLAKRLDDAIAVWQGSMVIWYRSQVGTTNHCNVCSAALLQHCVE